MYKKILIINTIKSAFYYIKFLVNTIKAKKEKKPNIQVLIKCK